MPSGFPRFQQRRRTRLSVPSPPPKTTTSASEAAAARAASRKRSGRIARISAARFARANASRTRETVAEEPRGRDRPGGRVQDHCGPHPRRPRRSCLTAFSRRPPRASRRSSDADRAPHCARAPPGPSSRSRQRELLASEAQGGGGQRPESRVSDPAPQPEHTPNSPASRRRSAVSIPCTVREVIPSTEKPRTCPSSSRACSSTSSTPEAAVGRPSRRICLRLRRMVPCRLSTCSSIWCRARSAPRKR